MTLSHVAATLLCGWIAACATAPPRPSDNAARALAGGWRAGRDNNMACTTAPAREGEPAALALPEKVRGVELLQMSMSFDVDGGLSMSTYATSGLFHTDPLLWIDAGRDERGRITVHATPRRPNEKDAPVARTLQITLIHADRIDVAYDDDAPVSFRRCRVGPVVVPPAEPARLLRGRWGVGDVARGVDDERACTLTAARDDEPPSFLLPRSPEDFGDSMNQLVGMTLDFEEERGRARIVRIFGYPKRAEVGAAAWWRVGVTRADGRVIVELPPAPPGFGRALAIAFVHDDRIDVDSEPPLTFRRCAP